MMILSLCVILLSKDVRGHESNEAQRLMRGKAGHVRRMREKYDALAHGDKAYEPETSDWNPATFAPLLRLVGLAAKGQLADREKRATERRMENFLSQLDVSSKGLEDQQVYVGRDTVSFLPKGTIRGEIDLEINDKTKAFLDKHGDEDLSRLEYGTDYCFCLHATKRKWWDTIRTKGLASSKSGACGPGIYLTTQAGVCRNAERTLEFTTFRYGTGDFKDEKCRFIVVLVMNPRQAITRGRSTCTGWVIAPEVDVLPICMVEADAKPFADKLRKTYPKNAHNTLMRKTLFATKAEIDFRKRAEKHQEESSNKGDSDSWD